MYQPTSTQLELDSNGAERIGIREMTATRGNQTIDDVKVNKLQMTFKDGLGTPKQVRFREKVR